MKIKYNIFMGIGDWGLGIGPIPNPQSPIPKTTLLKYYKLIINLKLLTLIILIINIA